MLWTNEPAESVGPAWSEAPDGAGVVGHTGYLVGDAPTSEAIVRRRPLPRLAGVWSLLGAEADGIGAVTCASGAEQVFVAEGADVVVVSSRALLAHLIVDPSGPHADPLGLTSIVSVGYSTTDRTVFDGVRALPPATHACVDRDGRLEIGDARWASEPLPVLDALRGSLGPLAPHGHGRVPLGLTGGRDSRLMLALLADRGIEVDARTSGLPGDPDVVVASRVAATLGIPHRITPPRGAEIDEGGVVVDVRGRVKEAIVLADGMLSAYDRVGRVGERYDARRAPFGGTGGEILRGYYAAAVKDPADPLAVASYLRGRVLGSVRNLTADARLAYEAEVAPWTIAASQQGPAALEDFYVRQRTGRWTGAARHAASIGCSARRPFLDHEVIRAVRAVDLHERMSERLVATLLGELAPALRDVPFAGRRWKFDTRPSDRRDLEAWEARAPVDSGRGDQATFNWRLDLPEVRAELASIVLDAPAGLWEVVDRRRVEQRLAAERPQSRQEVVRIWHIATAAGCLASGFWSDPTSRLVDGSSPLSAAAPGPVALATTPALSGRARRVVELLRSRLRR
ncbi:hypothetical protein K8Z61_15475 [Nocardioides sp. TRM66260-LWL]|uniref:asparagine synthase-related protein n=1 Tax=Nocardioides sp. TRM66260-LWL TaxID=2874478 RepID=UPI001CC33BF8|nr:asparagine synthase-related protein [Nocardioides sp. TRM66260-LWL]MBZ5735894.1 hypothetical protein [Nocardioides sp. TRM66260-LWL]